MKQSARRRLNGWIRIGIVVSVVWMLYITGTAAWEYIQHHPYASNFIEWRCEKTGESYVSLEKITGPFVDLVPLSATLRLGRFATALLAPILVFWITAITVVYTVRWISNGFARTKA
jgi:hypothetical protein